ncbi:MAG: 1-(5-phosphoribosyl)-5-[(5-phosphoribosylamino)methylideneamino] imidazole-4-carboxamide isomerase [Saprospiraceae bacterium]|nr:1-(5-phosphoribosyl)-5-[(5-phosphoribosylamino)methylideneamino] imidazole-4-carboxamide isomerase [Saprospiraceae bacterium]MCB0544090.1 1-(5-phosphoribosyl)-5-[(5-phosphoribosylamino)methylideneamino] imidazole-4-carboxamide isomerase [Saprospiraceae bacterium]MCB0576819.1 1-(5-phosphoribosyl)-5-[(5-phosphoribosylamino)methylideneamino] imidazole-4-carboxamide isomerase [Saprospiraceae bacterium]MCB9305743.1 1-(5-phosphoribosyl)-5-[(5-phosphoribosylamino)methylideneamino] imidazole-4-carbox
MEIIPSFDLLDGKLVRLRQGDFDKKTEYEANPLELAIELEQAGIRRLHMVDLDGARSGRPANLHILAAVAARTRLQIDYGGGLRSIPSLKQVWDAGAMLFSVGSVAVLAQDEFRAWVEKFGPDRFLVGADVRDRQMAVHGWTDQTEVSLFDFLKKMHSLGIRQISVTDIARDGELSGPATELYRDIITEFPDLEVVASGGISSIADLEELTAIGCAGAIVGKAFFEGKIPLQYFRVFSKV